MRLPRNPTTSHGFPIPKRRAPMPDNKTQTRPQDSSRVAMNEDYEVRYWTERFGVSKERLQEAVDAVGNGVGAVERYLRG